MCLSFKLTGVFLALMLFLVCADWISEDPVPVMVQSTHSPAWCSWWLTRLDAFLDREHLFLCISGLFLPPFSVWLHIWPKKKVWSGVSAVLSATAFGSTWTRLWKRHKKKWWTFPGLKSSSCGVDGNKRGGGCGLDKCMLDMCMCRRGKGKYRWYYLCFLPLIVLGFKAS